MTNRASIEFARWETPIENDELHLIDLSYGGGDWSTELVAERLFLEIPASERVPLTGLNATFLSVPQRALFRVSSAESYTFRVLDEHGLTELWSARNLQGKEAKATFRVRNHGWNRESELSFAMQDADFSFVVSTSWACLEIVSRTSPSVEFLRHIEAIRLADSGERLH
jgi:hypothetical protein